MSSSISPGTKLGRYEIRSKPRARKAYQDFFALWKDADADRSVLIEAKKAYQRLK